MRDKVSDVRSVHVDFYAAGATIITTNTYSVHRDRFEGVDTDEFAILVGRAVAVAQEARNMALAAKGGRCPRLRIAGSLGPLVCSYDASTCPPPAEAKLQYEEMVRLMAPHVDLFICETMASVAQAEGALWGAKVGNKPVWLAVTVADTDGRFLRSGEPISDLASLVAKYKPEVILVNCSRPEVVGAALEEMKAFGTPFGAYANGFVNIPPDYKCTGTAATVQLPIRTDLTPDHYAEFALAWVGRGATIVGGCCGVGPAHISVLAQQLRSAGHEIV